MLQPCPLHLHAISLVPLCHLFGAGQVTFEACDSEFDTLLRVLSEDGAPASLQLRPFAAAAAAGSDQIDKVSQKTWVWL